MSHIVIGTAGHIDHGKTALVKALTGIDTDRLEEEKKRGMTIDLGFAFLNENISIIDVPGHEKFIRNMVAGVSTINSALVVIAADDGIMPQTVEHLQILELLGVNNGVIALSKVDTSSDPDWLDLVEEEIRETIENTGLEGCPIIRTSVVSGKGIEELRQELFKQAKNIRISQNRGFFRMPVDRVFTKSGFGTVITGTVTSGTAGVGDQLMIYPGNKLAKIRGMQSHGNKVEQVSAGDRAAINLSNIDQKDVFRGSELSVTGAINISRNWIVNVKLLAGTQWQLKNRQKVHLHVGTAETLAVVSGLSAPLKAGESANLILTLSDEIPATQEDRYIIRSYSPVNTIGGGKILEISEKRLNATIRKRVKNLPVDLSERFNWLVNESSNLPKSITEWALFFGQSEDKIKKEIEDQNFLLTEGTGLVFSPNEFEKNKDDLVNIISKLHNENTFRSSINIEQVRLSSGFSNIWFDYCLESLLKDQRLERSRSGLSLPGYKVSVSKADMENIERLKSLIEKSTFETIAKKELLVNLKIPEDNLNSYLHYLKDNEMILNIIGDEWISQKAFNNLLVQLREFFNKKETLEVSDFKTMTGLSRKTAIPWLEYLDKFNFTARNGNVRSKGEGLL